MRHPTDGARCSDIMHTVATLNWADVIIFAGVARCRCRQRTAQSTSASVHWPPGYNQFELIISIILLRVRPSLQVRPGVFVRTLRVRERASVEMDEPECSNKNRQHASKSAGQRSLTLSARLLTCPGEQKNARTHHVMDNVAKMRPVCTWRVADAAAAAAAAALTRLLYATMCYTLSSHKEL